MAEPQGIIGDADTKLPDIPQTTVPPEQLEEEKKLARFSKTAEFKRLKEHLENRIKFYQRFFPSGKDIKTTDIESKEMGAYWKIANVVVGEFQQILDDYENARQAVEEDVKKRNT